MKDGPSSLFVGFMAVWFVLGLAGMGLMLFNRDVAFKRRIYPAFVIGMGALFLAFIVMSDDAPQMTLSIMVPIVVLITFLNLKFTKFCDACGETVRAGRGALSPPKFCPKCGAPLA